MLVHTVSYGRTFSVPTTDSHPPIGRKMSIHCAVRHNCLTHPTCPNSTHGTSVLLCSPASSVPHLRPSTACHTVPECCTTNRPQVYHIIVHHITAECCTMIRPLCTKHHRPTRSEPRTHHVCVVVAQGHMHNYWLTRCHISVLFRYHAQTDTLL